MTRRNPSSSRKANGHAASQDRTNGRGAAPAGGSALQDAAALGRAASDDARGALAAATAPSPAGCADRVACAESALPPHAGQKQEQVAQQASSDLGSSTDPEAMQDGAAYVNCVAERIDLVGASVKLLGSKDEKIVKAELDRLREMKFGKGPAVVMEEFPRIEMDLPRPVRD